MKPDAAKTCPKCRSGYTGLPIALELITALGISELWQCGLCGWVALLERR